MMLKLFRARLGLSLRTHILRVVSTLASSMHTIISPGWLARAPALSRQGGPLYEYSKRDSGKD